MSPDHPCVRSPRGLRVGTRLKFAAPRGGPPGARSGWRVPVAGGVATIALSLQAGSARAASTVEELGWSDPRRNSLVIAGVVALVVGALFLPAARRARLDARGAWLRRWAMWFVPGFTMMACGAAAVMASMTVVATWEGSEPTLREALALALVATFTAATGLEANRAGRQARRFAGAPVGRVLGLVLWCGGGLTFGVGLGIAGVTLFDHLTCTEKLPEPDPSELPATPMFR